AAGRRRRSSTRQEDSMLRSQLSAWMIRGLFGRVLGHAAASGVPGRPVVFHSRDGSKLAGALVSPPGPARGVVVLCHPFTRHGLQYFARADTPAWLARAGWHVALFNFKGFGRSELRGVNFADDVVGVVTDLRARWRALPMSLVGLSFGGFHAVTALAQLDG